MDSTMKLLLTTLAFFQTMIIINAAEYRFYSNVNKHYKFHRAPKTWHQAVETCKLENATLAMPINAAEAAVLTNIFNGYPSSMLNDIRWKEYIYLGFHDIFEEGEFITLKGKPIQYYYHTWNTKQPDNARNEDCGSMHRVGKINDLPCNSPGVFICEKGNTQQKLSCRTTDSAYKHSKGLKNCYKLHLNPRVWSVARAICEAEGSHLAIIRSKAEEDFLLNMFNDPENRVTHVHYKDYAFIGFHDLYTENHFMTVLDEDLHDVGYVHWAPKQPDNAHRNENCGSLYRNGGINDLVCSTAVPFFCQRPYNPDDNSGIVGSIEIA